MEAIDVWVTLPSRIRSKLTHPSCVNRGYSIDERYRVDDAQACERELRSDRPGDSAGVVDVPLGHEETQDACEQRHERQQRLDLHEEDAGEQRLEEACVEDREVDLWVLEDLVRFFLGGRVREAVVGSELEPVLLQLAEEELGREHEQQRTDVDVRSHQREDGLDQASLVVDLSVSAGYEQVGRQRKDVGVQELGLGQERLPERP